MTEPDRIDAQSLVERVASLRSEIDNVHERIFSDNTISSVSIDTEILGINKSWQNSLPSISNVDVFANKNLTNIFIRKPIQKINEDGDIFDLYIHFDDDNSSASINIGYKEKWSKVVTSFEKKRGIEIERVDDAQNDLSEGLRLQMLKEVLDLIASHLFD